MITIHELSREAYTSILKVMPNAIREVEQDYVTVSLKVTSATDIDTNNMSKYITLKNGTKFVHINCCDFHYITIS
jgi:hypothetical protein